MNGHINAAEEWIQSYWTNLKSISEQRSKDSLHTIWFFHSCINYSIMADWQQNLPNWIMPMSDEQGNDLLSRTKSQQKLVHLDLSKWQTTAKNNWSRFADERSPLLISFSVCQLLWFLAFFLLFRFSWHRWVFGFIEIWRQSVRSTAKLIGRGRCSSNYRWSPICQKSHMARHPIVPVEGVLDQDSKIPLKIELNN